MGIVVGITVWVSFGAFLFFPIIGAPPMFGRIAISLTAVEFVLAGIWTFGSEGCQERPCGALAEAARTAASVDVPILTVAMLALAVAYGLRARARG